MLGEGLFLVAVYLIVANDPRAFAVILQVRLYAMYSLNKKILVLMVVSFVVTSAAAAAVMGNVLSVVTGHNTNLVSCPLR